MELTSISARLHQPAMTFWLTGLPGAGKTTLARRLEGALSAVGQACVALDGDDFRRGMSGDLGFSAADRRENVRRAAQVARLMNGAGLTVVTAFISPLRADRRLARQIVGAARFVEVYLSADLATCESRDPKGLYRRARQGALADFTGVSAPYEAPELAQLILDTGTLDVDQCATTLGRFALARLAARSG